MCILFGAGDSALWTRPVRGARCQEAPCVWGGCVCVCLCAAEYAIGEAAIEGETLSLSLCVCVFAGSGVCA